MGGERDGQEEREREVGGRQTNTRKKSVVGCCSDDDDVNSETAVAAEVWQVPDVSSFLLYQFFYLCKKK